MYWHLLWIFMNYFVLFVQNLLQIEEKHGKNIKTKIRLMNKAQGRHDGTIQNYINLTKLKMSLILSTFVLIFNNLPFNLIVIWNCFIRLLLMEVDFVLVINILYFALLLDVSILMCIRYIRNKTINFNLSHVITKKQKINFITIWLKCFHKNTEP